jgi:hypothetical protein
MHSSVGIVLGRSNHTNKMLFWDPVTQRMNVSADYKLDPPASIGIHFPTVIYDGQISPMVLRGGKNSTKEPFPPGSKVQVELDGDYYQGTVQSVPNYQISFTDSPESLEVPISKLSALNEALYPLIEADTSETTNNTLPSLPDWIKDNTHVTLHQDGRRMRGILSSTYAGWVFLQHTASGQLTYQTDLAGLPVTWKERLAEGTFKLGWQFPEQAYHVSAKGLSLGTPASFQRSIKPGSPDQQIWIDSYHEEANGLKEQDTYITISAKEYASTYKNIQVLPSMAVQTIKKDEDGSPDPAKTRIVALGNHEDQVWTKSDKFAPVLRDKSS